ncbi:putative monooxygenase ydhR [Aquimarina sp. MAR_2010_214]|uniref:YdhR family protein n=1 Tax=Aquimarina sp. MAR_2010_214 TaxID=1250026 RepID=UPI000C70C39A|nr:YdhR family protein [Aquimarina sp. MAR_2010_214]PKV50209.1 putative monooxygenase ydhR [Aquimarina sp. MAR_2010_214]
MQDKKAIVNLRCKSNLPTEEICKLLDRRKHLLKNTKGLISLFCYINEETNTIGGTYIFKNMKLAQQYLEQFLTEGFGPKYGIIPMTLKIDIGCLKDEIQGGNTE